MDNPITNQAQARTAEEYVEYLSGKLRESEGDVVEMDRLLNEMIEIAGNLADYKEGDEWRQPKIRLVTNNGKLV